jgi:hypothetical protein
MSSDHEYPGQPRTSGRKCSSGNPTMFKYFSRRPIEYSELLNPQIERTGKGEVPMEFRSSQMSNAKDAE